MPSVIQLRSYVRVPYRARVPMTRAALMHRDRFCCAYCGGKPTPSTMSFPAAAVASTPGRTAWRAVRRATTARATTARELGWALRRAPVRRPASTGGCCPRSRKWIRPGLGTSAKARPDRHSRVRARGSPARDTVCVVNEMEIHLFLVGIPALLVIVLVALIGRARDHTRRATRCRSRGRMHPILWAAIDEAVDTLLGHDTAEFSVGGGASGTW